MATNPGSHKKLARAEASPFKNSGSGVNKILSMEHSSAAPLNDVSSKILLSALTIVSMGVVLYGQRCAI